MSEGATDASTGSWVSGGLRHAEVARRQTGQLASAIIETASRPAVVLNFVDSCEPHALLTPE